MAQVKRYGRKEALKNIRQRLSDTVHNVIVDILKFPQEKRYHRFIALDAEDMIFPDDKSSSYMIIEIMMMSGRSVETKNNLIRSLFSAIEIQIGIVVNDLEICIIEAPACNWGFRGISGDEIVLNYKVEI